MSAPTSHDLLTVIRTRIAALAATATDILTALGITGAIENAVQDAILEVQAVQAHLDAPMTDVGWVSEGASANLLAAAWGKIPVLVPANARRLGMFEVHVTTPGGLATVDYCWTHDEPGRYRITNNETLTIAAATLNPDGIHYSQTGGLGNVSNVRPSFGQAGVIWFWHRGDAAVGSVIPVLHGEL